MTKSGAGGKGLVQKGCGRLKMFFRPATFEGALEGPHRDDQGEELKRFLNARPPFWCQELKGRAQKKAIPDGQATRECEGPIECRRKERDLSTEEGSKKKESAEKGGGREEEVGNRGKIKVQ